MDSRRLLAFVLALVTAAGAVSAPVHGAPPSITVDVDGTDLSDGGTVTVTSDPSVTIDVSAEQSIESVDVRVDGTSRASFAPNSTSVSETITLDLDGGDNELRVVATAGETESVTGTVRLDTEAPRVGYTSPFRTDRYEGTPEEVIVENATVDLAGDLYDTTDVERLTVERIYEYEFAGTTERSREMHRLSDLGDSFEQELLLGLGTNTVKVQLRDESGHTAVHRFDLVLVDDQRPNIEIDGVERTGDGVRIRGVVSDNVKVNSLSVQVSGSGGSTYVLNPTNPDPDPDRQSVSFETTVPVPENAEQLELTVDDTAGNERTRTVPVGTDRLIAPDITIDEGATTAADGTVTVTGLVSGGEITDVRVETVTEDGAVVDLATVHAGEITDRVAVDASLDAAASGATTVRIRVTDSTGEEHVRSLTLDTATPAATATATAAGTVTATATAETEPTARATATVTPAPTPTPAAAGGGGPFAPGNVMNYPLVLWLLAVGVTYATRNDPTGHFWSRLGGWVGIAATVLGGGIALAGGAVPLPKFLAAVGLFAAWWWLLPDGVAASPSTASAGESDTRIYGNGGDGGDTNVYDPDDGDDTEIYDPDDN